MAAIEDLRILALRNAARPELAPGEYRVRRVQRWYSKTFHVPLPDVADLPWEDVLLAWYESHYEEMEPELLEEEVHRVTGNIDDAEDYRNTVFEQQTAKQAEAQEAAIAKKKKANLETNKKELEEARKKAAELQRLIEQHEDLGDVLAAPPALPIPTEPPIQEDRVVYDFIEDIENLAADPRGLEALQELDEMDPLDELPEGFFQKK